MTIYFLGGGNMATAVIAGLRNKGDVQSIHVVEHNEEKRDFLNQKYAVTTSDTLPELMDNDVLILAVKPQDMAEACRDIHTHGALVLSLAAGLTTTTLSRYLNGTHRIVRVMPNTPASVGLAVSGLFAAGGVNEQDKALATRLMLSCGEVVWLTNEVQMDAVTAISGSGSAYVFYFMNALFQAAVEQGFDETTAYALTLQTFKGAVALAEQSSCGFKVLQDQVTSKGGTTFAALETFRRYQIAEHVQQGVAAAAIRSREMAEQFV